MQGFSSQEILLIRIRRQRRCGSDRDGGGGGDCVACVEAPASSHPPSSATPRVLEQTLAVSVRRRRGFGQGIFIAAVLSAERRWDEIAVYEAVGVWAAIERRRRRRGEEKQVDDESVGSMDGISGRRSVVEPAEVR